MNFISKNRLMENLRPLLPLLVAITLRPALGAAGR
jgi:hypothetical protein